MGRALEQAEEWLARNGPTMLAQRNATFIQESLRSRRRQGRAIMPGMFASVFGVVVTFVAILYLSQFRDGLIDARVQSLLVQGEIVAAAIAASAAIEQGTILIDPGYCSCKRAKATQPSPGPSPGSSSR